MLTQLPKTARDVLATAVHDGGIARLLEIAILRLLELGEDFAIADDLAVPFYGGVRHLHRRYFLLSRNAYDRFPTENDDCLLGAEHSYYLFVRNEDRQRAFRIGLSDDAVIDQTWIYDVPVMLLPMLVERMLQRESSYAMAAVVTLIRKQGLDEAFAVQLNSACHAAYLDCLNEVRQEAAYERD